MGVLFFFGCFERWRFSCKRQEGLYKDLFCIGSGLYNYARRLHVLDISDFFVRKTQDLHI